MSLKQLLSATAVAVVLAPSVPVALADSVIYLDRHNVVAASPDGVTERVLTTNGTEGAAVSVALGSVTVAVAASALSVTVGWFVSPGAAS